MKSSLFFLSLLIALAVTPAVAKVPVLDIVVDHVYPHDPSAYTEGLFYLDGSLYESTGVVGQSTIRKVNLDDGAILKMQAIPPALFGEGIVAWNHEILSITWRDHAGFRWDLDSFAEKSRFTYTGEGWALTHDGHHIIMSDGTATLRYFDPATMKEVKHLDVTADGQPVYQLNELEWVDGEIYANVWRTNYIARIDPATGHVKAWINLAGLPETLNLKSVDDVANGIAYDHEKKRLFVTGKRWPHLYQIHAQTKP